MTLEFLGEREIPKADHYEAKVGCFNCDHVCMIQVKKGLEIDKFIKDTKYKCRRCECIETLQSWKQYLAGRALVSQIMELSQKEEDIESKKGMSHIG